jgi:hypothetical protein
MKHKAVMPFILVGLRSDLRGQAKQQLAQDSPPKDVSHFVLPSEAEAFAETIGAIGYMETSGVTGHNVKKIFERLTIESVINPEVHPFTKTVIIDYTRIVLHPCPLKLQLMCFIFQ